MGKGKTTCENTQSVHFRDVKSTLTDLHRFTRKVMRPVLAGKQVAITEHGAPLARISPDYERRVLPAVELRKLPISDQSILDAIAESRE